MPFGIAPAPIFGNYVPPSGPELPGSQYTSGQLEQLRRQGKISYQQFLQMQPNTVELGAPANNAMDKAAQQAANSTLTYQQRMHGMQQNTGSDITTQTQPGNLDEHMPYDRTDANTEGLPTNQSTTPSNKPNIPAPSLNVGGGVSSPVLNALNQYAAENERGAQQIEQDTQTIKDAEKVKSAPSTIGGEEGTSYYPEQRAAETVSKLEGTAAALTQANQAQEKLFTNKALSDANARYDEIKRLASDAAGRGVNADRLMESKGVFGRIGSAIAMGLGAFGAAMPHTGGKGVNFAMDIIQSSIRNDIEAQKENIENQWKNVAAQAGIAHDKDAMNSFVLNKMHERGLMDIEMIKHQINGTVAQMQGELAPKNAAMMNLQLDQMLHKDYLLPSAALRYELMAKKQQLTTPINPLANVQKNYQEDLRKAQNGYMEKHGSLEGFSYPSLGDYAKGMLGMGTGGGASAGGGTSDPSVVMVPNADGGAPSAVRFADPEIAKLMRANSQHATSIVSTIDELLKERAKNGGGSFSPTNTANMQAKLGAIAGELQDMNGSSRLTDTELKLLGLAPGELDPNGLNLPWRADPTEQLKSLRATVLRKLDSGLSAAGARPVGQTVGGNLYGVARPLGQ